MHPDLSVIRLVEPLRVFKGPACGKNKMPARSRSRSYGRSVRARTGRSMSRSRSRSVYPRGYVARLQRSVASRSLNVHKFSRYALGTSIVDVTGVQHSNNHTFSLDRIVNAGEFTQLFDQFKITKVVVTYQLLSNPDGANVLNVAGNNPTSANWYPTVWSIADYDDSATMNISEMKERIGVKNRILKPNQKMVFVVRPKVLVQTYRTLTTTGYAPKSMFIDLSAPDVPHYGLKTVIDCGGIDPIDTIPFRILQEFKYYFTCKNVR